MTRLSALVSVSWAIALCFIVYHSVKPLTGLVEALNKECVVGLPEKPDGPYHLEWIKTEKRKR